MKENDGSLHEMTRNDLHHVLLKRKCIYATIFVGKEGENNTFTYLFAFAKRNTGQINQKLIRLVTSKGWVGMEFKGLGISIILFFILF